MWRTDWTNPNVEPWWIEKPKLIEDVANLGEMILSEYMEKAEHDR